MSKVAPVGDWARLKPAGETYRAELNQYGGDHAIALMIASRKMREIGIFLSCEEWASIARSNR